MPEYLRLSRIDAAPERVFDWHLRPGAATRLLPPWWDAHYGDVLHAPQAGERTRLDLRVGGVPLSLIEECRAIESPTRLAHGLVRGPIPEWETERGFRAEGEAVCVVEDTVRYRLPRGFAGALDARARRELDRIFDFRQGRVRRDLARHARYASAEPMRVAITGASGLIGAELAAYLASGGHRVLRLVRRRARPECDEVFWDPVRGEIDAAALDGVDAVVHLAGENIAGGLWTRARRNRILDSRSAGTELLAKALAGLDHPPRVFVSGSAIGIYGDTGGNIVEEGAGTGEGFLSDVCRAWEGAAALAARSGIRVVTLRTGVVMSPRGGALQRLLLPFRLGLGGRVGSGRQLMSWVALDDVLGAIQFVMAEPSLVGPVNVVAPEPVDNAEFAQVLGGVLRRPSRLPVPEGLVRTLLGDMGSALLLASQGVAPGRLSASGFAFQFPTLEALLRFELGLR